MRIKFFTTGGTIDKVYFDARSEFEVGPSEVAGILEDARVTLDFEIESILRKDSLDLTEADRALVRERILSEPCPRVIVTHGTDTMIETALALGGIPGKTVVLTGSLLPSRFRVTDAPFNVGTAVGAVQCLPPGVYVLMNGRVFDPRTTRKNRAENRFEAAPPDSAAKGL